MNRILMAASVAVLVSSASLAFAAAKTYPNDAALPADHCSYLNQLSAQTTFKSEAAAQVAEEKGISLCRQDRHKNGGQEIGTNQDRGGASARG